MPPTTSERIYQELRQLVVTGELAPGDRLVQRQLATRLGVSSIPVVEAMRRLEQDGLVVSHPNWGVQVREWTDLDIEGAYLAREALEGIAAGLFVERAGEVERLILKQHAARFVEKIHQRDTDGWLQADLDFHGHIVRSTKAYSLIRLVEGSCLITLTLRNAHQRIIGEGTKFPEATIHDEMVEALCGANREAAERAGRAHVRQAYEKLLRLMNDG